tara:strand:+ start:537 stop:1235 length:699 start_codon:yes stop_codon:yes gene_type:complete
MNQKNAVVLLSGGLDSATILAMALQQNYRVHALSVAYGQRHGAELAAASRIAQQAGVASHQTMHVDLDQVGGSALTDARIEVPTTPGSGIPVTYVPARNTLFLSLALGLAEVVNAVDLFIGVNAVDYSGYPDCRPQFVDAFEKLANLATRAGDLGARFKIHAPLMTMSKAQIISEGIALGVDYAQTVSCYRADADGHACGSCDSCRLRKQGFLEAGVEDPTSYFTQGATKAS